MNTSDQKPPAQPYESKTSHSLMNELQGHHSQPEPAQVLATLISVLKKEQQS
jgi:hypothetical protein